MGLYDQHLHSHHSFDSQARPRDNVEAALVAGLSGLTFTEHFDTHPTEWPTCRYDDLAILKDLERLREDYGDRLFVGKGIEVCYQPERTGFILDFLHEHCFDMVILSVHWTDGSPIHHRERWADVSAEDVTRRYLETVVQAVHWAGELHRKHGPLFDALGHLDLAKRYTQRYFESHCVDRFADLVDDILRACLEASIVPEVNTSTLRQGLDEPMPGPRTVRRYAELGGLAMSLGSDAHHADHIGHNFDRAARMLLDGGIRYEAVFARDAERREAGSPPGRKVKLAPLEG